MLITSILTAAPESPDSCDANNWGTLRLSWRSSGTSSWNSGFAIGISQGVEKLFRDIVVPGASTDRRAQDRLNLFDGSAGVHLEHAAPQLDKTAAASASVSRPALKPLST